MLIIAAAAAAAGVLGALAPLALRRLPEPENPEPGKPLYARLAESPFLAVWLGVSAALTAGVVASRIEPDTLIPVWIVMSGFGVLLAYIDWHTKLLPYLLVVPLNALILVLVALAAGLERDWSILTRALISAAVVYTIFWLSNLLIPAALGFGDVRLSFGLALALGTISGGAVLFGLWIGFALGAIGSLLLRALKVIDGRDFAFGPYLILGALIGAVCGTSVFDTVY